MKSLFVLTAFILSVIFSSAQTQQVPLSRLLPEENYSAVIKQLKDKEDLSGSELLTLAFSYKQTGHPSDAIVLIENGTHGNDPDIIELLSALYFETGNYNKALPLIKNIYEEHPENYRNFIRYVDILTFNKEYIDAISLLEKGFEEDTLNFDIIKRLGDNNIKIDSLKQAVRYYDLLFTLYPENQVVASRLARLFMKTEEYRKSLNVCETILKTSPDNVNFLTLKGRVYFKVAQYMNAIIVMKKLEKLGEHSLTVQRILGISYYKKGDYIDAAKYLKEALEWNPNDAVVNYYLGAALGMLPVPEDGLPYLTDAIALLQPPSHLMEKIHQSMAGIYFNTNNYNLAIENYKKALKYNPEGVEYYLHIASVYDEGVRNKNEALKYYEKFLASLPEKLDPKKGRERYKINLKKYVERRITKIKEDNFF